MAETDYALLAHQIRQLTRQRTQRRFELIIGDNGGSLDLGERPTDLPITVVDASGTPGPGHARNVAVNGSSGQFLLFCDADDLVGPAWVENHASVLSGGGFTAGSFLSVLPGDDRWSVALGGLWPSTGFSSGMRHHEGVPFATTANLGVRRSLFDSVGGFPVEYLRSEDVAFSLALRRVGVMPRFVACAEVIKAEGRRGRVDSTRVAYEAGRSRVRLARDFAIGPRPSALALRSALRTARAVPVPLIRIDGPTRSFGREAAEMAGIAVQCVRGSR